MDVNRNLAYHMEELNHIGR